MSEEGKGKAMSNQESGKSEPRKFEPLTGGRNTKCFCIYCPHHPLFEKRAEFNKILTDFDVSYVILDDELRSQGVEVTCLKPESNAFGRLDIDPNDFEFPQTGYQDGESLTGFYSFDGYKIWGWCANEDYADDDE